MKQRPFKIETILFSLKAPVLLAVMLALIVLLATFTTANAKGEIGGTRYSVQQLQQLVDEAHAKFKY